jgi:tRNA(Ile)-lysidine synthase
LRNRTRLELLPLLKSYNPRITEALLRTAFIAEGDATYLENEVSSVWNEIVQERKGFISLNKERLLALHPTLQRYLLRTSLRKLLGSLKNIEALHVEDIVSALSKTAGKKLNLPAGLVFSVEYDRYLLAQDIESSCPYPVLEGETPLMVSGDTLLPGWRVIATIRDALQARCQRGSKSPVIGREQMADVPDNFIAYFDFDRTGKYLSVRTRRRGDRFHPMGMSEAKKLGEFMINAKIPRDWRSNIPIISSPSQILWIVGWRIDDRVKITEGTQKVLCLKMERR